MDRRTALEVALSATIDEAIEHVRKMRCRIAYLRETGTSLDDDHEYPDLRAVDESLTQRVIDLSRQLDVVRQQELDLAIGWLWR